MSNVRNEMKIIKKIKKMDEWDESRRSGFLFTIVILVISSFMTLSFAENGADIEELKVNVSVKSIEKYIEISTPFNFSMVIPGHEYHSFFTVKWAIPQSALAQIESEDVLIFVEVSVVNETNIYFKKDGELTKVYNTILKCRIVNETCGEGSKLSETIPFYFKLEKNGEELNDFILIKASIIPFGSFENLDKNIEEINETITNLKKQIFEEFMLSNLGNNLSNVSTVAAVNVTNISINNITLADLFEKIKQVEEKLKEYDIESAKKELAYVKDVFEDMSVKYLLVQKLDDIKMKVNELSLKDMSAEQKELFKEIRDRTAEAENALNSSAFEKVNSLIYEINEKFVQMQKMEEKKVWNLYLYGGIFVLIVLFIAVLLIGRKPKFKEKKEK